MQITGVEIDVQITGARIYVQNRDVFTCENWNCKYNSNLEMQNADANTTSKI